ncbi:MAG: VCBS repeat-containing protein [Bacteroidetes bacterium]|nr:VCBS repeat-containing protein [Bacteroidota bacterium]
MIYCNRFLYLFFLWVEVAYAQPFFTRQDTIKVEENSIILKNAWAGGINSAQFSSIDLDLDGKKDLFIFDRSGNRITTYLNIGSIGVSNYKHAPQFQTKFPPLHDWALLVDYNCDGKEDIFTYSIAGFAVYENTSSLSSGLQFSLVKSQVKSKQFNNVLNLYVSSVDIPALVDVDSDGDIDVLTFQLAGSYVEYHKNLSKELYGSCDSLAFELRNNCWGYFSENPFNNNVQLNDTCSFNVLAPEKNYVPTSDFLQQVQHAGSSLLALDLDGDNDKELIIGDISFKNLVMLTNGGTSSGAKMIAQQPTFPTNSVAVNLSVFPTGYSVDIDNDNLNDLIVTPSAPNISENFKSVWLYKNIGTSNNTAFSHLQDNFLQDGMIDAGENAHPATFDYNADNLQDLVIGNYGYFQQSGGFQSTLTLYENTGTATNPKFNLITRDYASIGAYNFLSIHPTFGDIDGDGDTDMLIGESTGKLNLFTNTAGASNPASFVLSQANYQSIDVGSNATPQLVDANEDGLLDLVIGELGGNLNYYENIGSTSVATFSLVSQNFGNVKVNKPITTIVGSSTPFLFKQSNTFKLFVGSEYGSIYVYDNISNNLSGTFNIIDSMYLDIWESPKSAPFLNDLNNDNYLDLLLGTNTGGVALYMGGVNTTVESSKALPTKSFIVYPTIAENEVTIKQIGICSSNTEIELLTITGVSLQKIKINCNETVNLNLSNFSCGIYFFRNNSLSRPEYSKLIISR